MNEAERKSLTVLQQAFAVIDGREPSDEVVRHLHRLERNSPDLFNEVVSQLEKDNGRWSAVSNMPSVEVIRDDERRIEAIIFSEQQTPQKIADLDAFLWVSDRVDVKWFEAFAEELIRTNSPRARALMTKPPFPPQFAKRSRDSSDQHRS
jgi:hypothetical protein